MPKQFQFDGVIRNVSYLAKLTTELTEYDFSRFDVNTAKPFGLIHLNNQKIAYARWDSPNYESHQHFARIYNIYNTTTKIVIIPVMKDGGLDGKLEYIQSSVLSWMNLAGVYIILDFYDNASKNKTGEQKIINQKLNTEVLHSQIIKLTNYKSDPMRWNRNLFEDRLKKMYQRAIRAYEKTSINIKVKVHPKSMKLNALKKITTDLQRYEGISTNGSKRIRQDRELHTNKITEPSKNIFYLIDGLGGVYYLSSKEVSSEQGVLVIQETRRTSRNFMPPIHQIQDALFRLSLTQNIDVLYYNGREVRFQSRLKLYGNKVIGNLLLPCKDKTFNSFIKKNKGNLSSSDLDTLLKMRQEIDHNPHLIIEIDEIH
jgi:hypothetical protein